MRIIIALGSHSRIKADAAREACLALGVAATIVPTARRSCVRAQPVGREETLLGAHNRAKAPLDANDMLGVGIENGLVHEGGIWYDVAAVVVATRDGRTVTRWSEMVAVPDGYVARAQAAGFDRKTVGEVIAEDLGTAADDPHAALTAGRLTREGILKTVIADALEEALRSVPTEGEKVMEKTHRIRIGSFERDLPVREVAPGIRVALFNILGDWALAEAAGKKLAEKLPMKIDALVMPDGKATALLHVMGRSTGLPTFVARKEKKPYMDEPVRNATYKSITTAREQTLFLGAADAAALSGKKVFIVDDVVSTGGTLEAMKLLMAEVGAEVVGIAAVFTEGGAREDVISLGDLPLF